MEQSKHALAFTYSMVIYTLEATCSP